MQLKFRTRNLELRTPSVMGILNITPDSFFDGGKYTNENSILIRIEKMISEGADIIDIGACSTRPNAKEVPEDEELTRLIPVIKLVKRKFPDIIISVDTFRSKVAEYSVQEGADMINDVAGGVQNSEFGDNKMFEVVGKLNVPYVLMHTKGTPQTMQKNPHYENVMDEVISYFKEKVRKLESLNVKQIVIDPGFGFGKTTEHNYKLLKHLSKFKEFGFPILAGVSRKAMVNKVLDTKPEDALNGTTAVNTIALMNRANILRVHDVKEAKEAVKIFNFAQNQ